MAKDVDINIRVNGGDQAEKQGEKFVGLTRKIRELRIAIQQAEAAGDDLSLGKLRKELDDTNDKLDRVNFQNKEFADKLGALPGPLGKAGGAVAGLKQQFETFGFGLTAIVAVVGLIVGAFALLKGAVGASEEQTAKWNKVLIFGERILNGLFAALEPVLDVIFDLIAPLMENATVTTVLTKAFAGLAAGMVFIIKVVVNLIGAFGDLWEAIKTVGSGFSLMGQSISEFFSGNFSKSADLAKQALSTFSQAGATLFENIKKRGKDIIDSTVNTFNAAEVKVAEGMKRQTKTEKEIADKRKKNNEDAAKEADELLKKRLEAIKAEQTAREAALEKEKQLALAAAKTAQEKLDIEKKFLDDKLALQLEALDKQMALYSKDSLEYKNLASQKTAIEAQQIAASIKYKDDTAKIEEDKKKEKEEKDKEDKEKAKEAALLDIEDKTLLLDAEAADISSRRALTFQEELDYFDKAQALAREKLVKEGATQAALIAFDKQTAAARVQIQKAQEETKLAIISDALGAVADAVGRETVAGKALAVAQAVMNTYVGANKALAAYPPPFGAIAAGTVIIAGLLNVKKILSTKIPAPPGGKGAPADSSSSAAGSISVGGGAGAPPAASTATQQNLIPVIGSSAASAGSAIANTLNSTFSNNQQRPIQAFVVSGDVSSAQQLERRKNTAAQLGG